MNDENAGDRVPRTVTTVMDDRNVGDVERRRQILDRVLAGDPERNLRCDAAPVEHVFDEAAALADAHADRLHARRAAAIHPLVDGGVRERAGGAAESDGDDLAGRVRAEGAELEQRLVGRADGDARLGRLLGGGPAERRRRNPEVGDGGVEVGGRRGEERRERGGGRAAEDVAERKV